MRHACSLSRQRHPFDVSSAADLALVLRVRLLQQRLRLLARVLRVFFVVFVVAMFGVIAARPELKLSRCGEAQREARASLSLLVDARGRL